jgi:hypothetical protein
VIAGAIGHGDVPLERVARELLRQTDPSHHPFFDVAISLAPSLAPLPTGWHMTAMDVQSGGARWDLYLELSETPEGLLGRAQYNPDLFFPETIDKTLEDFSNLLEAASSDTSLQLSKSLAAT